MRGRRWGLVGSIVLVLALVAGIGLWRTFEQRTQELHLVPRNPEPGAELSGSVGLGTCQLADARACAREALRTALGAGRLRPHTVIVSATAALALAPAVAEIRSELGGGVRVFGTMSGAETVFTPVGLLRQRPGDPPAIAVLAIATKEIVFGVGATAIDASPSLHEAARAATTRAVRMAAQPPSARPRAVLLAATDDGSRSAGVLSGIASVVGPDTPVLGGRTGAVVLEDGSAGAGIAVAVLYTSLPFGWTFEGGYDVSGRHSGVITKMDGPLRIAEIEGRPAADVYDEWLGGNVRRLYLEKPAQEVWGALAASPFYVRMRAPTGEVYSIFIHVWPTDLSFETKSLEIGKPLEVGERVHLASGAWETLLNRVGNLPRAARKRSEVEQAVPLLGFGYVCQGVMDLIPEHEREKAPPLISASNGGAPFLAVVTWGEYGCLTGLGNCYGNLLSSFMVVSPRSAERSEPAEQ